MSNLQRAASEVTGSRRDFLITAAKVGLLASLGSAACSGAPSTSPTPVTSTPTLGLQDRLDVLLSLYEGHGLNVASGFRGAASEAEIAGANEQLGFEIPADVGQLWTWNNGWVDSADGDPFWFRDSWLTGTHEIQLLRETMEYYNYKGVGVDIDRCVPIAEFDGSVLAVAAGEQTLLPGHPLPVISFFEGVDAHYHSVAAMVETAIAWVSAPGYDAQTAVPPDESAIWQRLNPDLAFWN